MSLITTKFHEILLRGFRRVALTKKGLMDGQVQNIIPFATHCVGYNKVIHIYY